MNELGTTIHEARIRKGITQAQLSKEVGISQSYLAKIESGKQIGSIPNIGRIANALGLPQEALFLKAGFKFVPSVGINKRRMRFDAETYQFAELKPKVKRVLLDIARILERYTED